VSAFLKRTSSLSKILSKNNWHDNEVITENTTKCVQCACRSFPFCVIVGLGLPKASIKGSIPD
jgi:hypothetical protein